MLVRLTDTFMQFTFFLLNTIPLISDLQTHHTGSGWITNESMTHFSISILHTNVLRMLLYIPDRRMIACTTATIRIR